MIRISHSERILKLSTLLMLILNLVGCTAINPYELHQEESAFLINVMEVIDNARYAYYLQSIAHKDGNPKNASPGFLDTNPEETIYTIPTGNVTVGVIIKYSPIASWLKNYDKTFIIQVIDFNHFRDLGGCKSLCNEILDSTDIKYSGLKGIEFNARKGHTYRFNCMIESGKAYIWVENNDGEKVSHEVLGGIPGAPAAYFIWETLPNPGEEIFYK